MVNEGARPGAMLFSSEFSKKNFNLILKKIDKLKKITPKLKYVIENMFNEKHIFIFNPKGKNKKYYDSKNNKMKLFKDYKKIGDFLGYTCVGEMNFPNIKQSFTIRYLGNGYNYYTEVCWKLNPKRVKQIKAQYKKMKEVGKKYGLNIELEIEIIKGNPNLSLIE